MQPYRFEHRQLLPLTVEQAWEFFSDQNNLPQITPPGMAFRFYSQPPKDSYAGMIFSYSLRPLFGITMNWTAEITQMRKPFFFVDEQRFGPYRFWHHQHFFNEVKDGVEVYDLIHYLLPHIQFTAAVNRFIVVPRLKRIFDFRRKTLEKFFPSTPDITNLYHGGDSR